MTSLLIALCLFLASETYAQCTTPTNAVASYSNNITSLNWDAVPGVQHYNIEIKLPGYPWQYPEFVTTSTTNSLAIPGVMQSITFDWRVNAVCTSGTSNWQEQQFTTPCPQPTALTVSNVSMTGADLSWTPSVGYNTITSNFVLAYRVLGSTSGWTSLGSTFGSMLSVTGLTPGVSYEWCVNQTCAYFNSSPSISTFTTLNCNSAGINNNEWIKLFKFGGINRSSGKESGGYVSTNLITNLNIGSTNNKGNFKAGFAGGSNNQEYAIFIDFNGNGDYSDPGEMVEGPNTVSTTGKYTFRFNVPNNVTPGNKGMRVIMQRAGTGPITGCLNNFFGETEDYIVNLSQSSNKMADESIVSTLEEDGNVEVFPNPSEGKFNVMIPSAFYDLKFEVVDMDGKLIQSKSLEKVDTFCIDLSAYPTGLYILNIIDNEGEKHIFKLMKNK